MIFSATLVKPCPTAREYQQQWAEVLQANTRPRSEATNSNQSDPVLCFVANFLLSLPEEGLLRVVIEKFVETRAVYIVGTVLHVHTLRLCKRDEVNFILLATHFGIIDKVWVHNFHIYHYLIAGRIHVRIALSYWGVVQLVLSYISKRLWVNLEEERSGTLKITFDDFFTSYSSILEGQEALCSDIL